MRCALVTGADTGLGKGFVEELIAKGWFVYAAVRKEGSAPIHVKAEEIVLDVTKPETSSAATEFLESRGVRLDLLVNNAGISKNSPGIDRQKACNLVDLDMELLIKMFTVNAIGPIIVVQKLLPVLAQQAFIVNISSDRASYHDEYPNDSGDYGYCASKAALNMLTNRLVSDLPSSMKTFAVHPGGIATRINSLGTMSPRESAKAICAIMDDWDPSKNGAFLRYDGSFYPL